MVELLLSHLLLIQVKISRSQINFVPLVSWLPIELIHFTSNCFYSFQSFFLQFDQLSVSSKLRSFILLTFFYLVQLKLMNQFLLQISPCPNLRISPFVLQVNLNIFFKAVLRVMFRQRVILLFQFGEHQSRFLIYWMTTSDACRGYIFSLINLIIFSFSSFNWLARPPLLKYVGYLLFVERIKSSIFLLFSTPIILITNYLSNIPE